MPGGKAVPPPPEKHHQMPKERHNLLSSNTLFLLTTIFSALIHHVSTDDAAVMAKLAKSLIPSPVGWTGPTFCKWPGVNCDTLNKVSSINLASKSLSGTLPPEINQLSNLKFLSLQRNRLSGPLPSLSKLESLKDVNLDENLFDSIPPDFLSGLTSLQVISINNNTNLPPWKLPDTLKDSTSLTSFFASKANIAGEIPDIFGSLPNFQSLRLSYNNLTGPLPPSMAKSNIQNLWLNNQLNGFSGTIDVLESMTSLKVVWLHANQFTGQVPDLSGCTELSDLLLRDNLLTGVIPDSLTKLPKLHNVALQSNSFQGPMPSFRPDVQVNLGTENHFCLPTPGPCDPQVTILLEIAGAMYYPMDLAESWDGNDACKQWAFITCEKGGVSVVNFAKQGWPGTISPAYAKLTNLKSLFLNDNKLVGTIPQSLTTLKQLQILDLSNNNISGKIPVFLPSVLVKVSGNPFIGKDVAIVYPGGRAPSNNEANDGKESSSMSTWVIILLVLVFIIVFAVVGFFIYRHCVNKEHKGFTNGSGVKSAKLISSNMGQESSNTPSGSNSDYHVYEGANIIIDIEVLRQATDNFSENTIIGKGGFGVVHKGQLQDGTNIAVKRMESSAVSTKGLNEFKAEIEVLTTVRHRNLVSLLGFCNNGGERLLVYEYMPQGCLGHHLFQCKKIDSPPLTWSQRVNIALDVARGVEYLHSMAQQSFIHRDLKPSNILLGDDMRAKVSDFGLVRPAPDGNYSIETRLAGTFGYLAPEYAATGRVTRKVDVYAFGVVLMEIITGRKSLDGSLPEESSNLVAWFRPFLLQDKNELKNAMDPTLLSAMDDETFQSIWKVAELSGHCTNKEANQRPDMSHAVNVLSSLVEQWTPTLNEEDNLSLDFSMSLPQVLQKWKASEGESTTMSTDIFNQNSSNYGTSSTSISGKHI